MRVVKRIVAMGGILALATLAAGGLSGQATGPDAAPRTASRAAPGSPAFAPARADVAEAVFTMVMARAADAGLAQTEPLTLCQACVAAHLGLSPDVVRQRCQRACGLR